MNYLADAASDIAQRIREIADEEAAPPLDQASGDMLDWYGRRAKLDRLPSESDYTLRGRIKEAMQQP